MFYRMFYPLTTDPFGQTCRLIGEQKDGWGNGEAESCESKLQLQESLQDPAPKDQCSHTRKTTCSPTCGGSSSGDWSSTSCKAPSPVREKPSGKCSVPEAVHLQWKNASKVEREHMIDELEKAGWSKDCGFTNPIKQRSLNTLEDLIPVFSSYSFSNDSQLIVASLFGRNCSLAASPKCLRRPTSYRSARNVGGSRKMQCPRFWDGVGV